MDNGLSCWIKSRWLRQSDEVEESPDCRGMGAADTSEIIRRKTSATRPAREWIFKFIVDQPIQGGKKVKCKSSCFKTTRVLPYIPHGVVSLFHLNSFYGGSPEEP